MSTLSRLPWAISAHSVPGRLIGLAAPGEDPPVDNPSDPVVDPGTPSDTPSSDAPSDTPTSDTPSAADTSSAPAEVVRVEAGASMAELSSAYWSGETSTSFTIYAKNTGNVPVDVRITYTLPIGVDDRGSADCTAGHCTFSLATDAQALLTVNVTVSPTAWRNAPLTGKIEVHAERSASIVTADKPAPDDLSTNWDVSFPPGPPVHGLALTTEDVPLGAVFSTAGQLVVHFTNTGAVPGQGELQVIAPTGVSVTGFPAECVSHHKVSATVQSCALGSVPAGASVRVAFGLSVSARARADAPVAGLVRAYLSPVGLDPLATQASWQIIAAPATVGAVASQGVLPSPSPTKFSAEAPQASLSDGPIGLVTQYANAAVEAVGWRLVVTSLLLLIVVLIGLSLGLRRRRIRPVPLFPPPLPSQRGGPILTGAAKADDKADDKGADGKPGAGRRADRHRRPVVTGAADNGESASAGSPAAGGVAVLDGPSPASAAPIAEQMGHIGAGEPLPRRQRATPPDVSVGAQPVAGTGSVAQSGPAPAGEPADAGAAAAPDSGRTPRRASDALTTAHLPVIGPAQLPNPFAANGYAPNTPLTVKLTSAEGTEEPDRPY
jgi:hypothetical protein